MMKEHEVSAGTNLETRELHDTKSSLDKRGVTNRLVNWYIKAIEVWNATKMLLSTVTNEVIFRKTGEYNLLSRFKREAMVLRPCFH